MGGEGHSVIDSKTGEITNTGGNIRIGDNNWVCMNVCFLKRAQIENGNVVGYGSIVSKPIDASRCVIAGNPAKVIKTDILWADAAPWAYNGEIYRGAPDNGN